MNRKGFFRSLLGGAAVPAMTGAEEEAEALDSVRAVMREEIERMMNAPISTSASTSKRYGPDGRLEWVADLSDDGTTFKSKWRRPHEGEE